MTCRRTKKFLQKTFFNDKIKIETRITKSFPHFPSPRKTFQSRTNNIFTSSLTDDSIGVRRNWQHQKSIKDELRAPKSTFCENEKGWKNHCRHSVIKLNFEFHPFQMQKQFAHSEIGFSRLSIKNLRLLYRFSSPVDLEEGNYMLCESSQTGRESRRAVEDSHTFSELPFSLSSAQIFSFSLRDERDFPFWKMLALV